MNMALIITQVALFAGLITIVFVLKRYFISEWSILIRLWGWAMVGIASAVMLAVSITLIVMGDIIPVLLPMVVGSLAGVLATTRKFLPKLFRRIQSMVIVLYVVVALGMVALLYNSGVL